MNQPARTILGLAVASALSLSFAAQAEGLVSPDLQQRLLTAPLHEVIVTFSDHNHATRLSALTASVRPLKELPMAGAILTSAQVREVAGWDGVESIYFNAPLKFFNYEAGEITGGHAVHDQLALTLQDDLTHRIANVRARGVLIDISSLDVVDSFIGRMISNISSMARVLDAVTVVVGMQPAVAITLVELGLPLDGVHTALNVEKGMALLRKRLGNRV